MPTISQLREMYPDAKDASDEEILSWVQQRTGLPLDTVAKSIGYSVPESDTLKEFAAGYSGYKAALQHGLASIGSGIFNTEALQSYAKENTQRQQALQALSKYPHSYEEIEFGSKEKGVVPYLTTLAAGSAPYIAEQVAYGVGDFLTGGALTPAHATRLGELAATAIKGKRAIGEGLFESVARQKLEQGVARTITGAEVSYPSSVGQMAAAQYEQSGQYDSPSALALGGVHSLLGQVGIEGAVARGSLNVANIANRPLRALGTGLMSGVSESGGEVGQAIIENVAKYSVDKGYDLLGEDAMRNIRESAVGGFALGKTFGTTGGLFSKNPSSLLPNVNAGETDNLNNTNVNNDGTGIADSIRTNSPEYTTNTSADSLLGAINPYDVGGQVTAFKQGADTSIDQAQQGLFGGLSGQEATMQAEQIAQASREQQDAQRQAQQLQQTAKLAATYGVTPANKPGEYFFGGKPLFGQAQVNGFLAAIDAIYKGKPEVQKELFGSIIKSGAVQLKNDASPKTAVAAVNKFVTSYGLDDAESNEEIADRLNTHILSLQGPKGLNQASVLNDLYKNITGQDSQAFTTMVQQAEAAPAKTKGRKKLEKAAAPSATAPGEVVNIPVEQYLQEKGISNEQVQQLQNAPRVGEVRVEGRTAEAGDERIGLVRPSSVQPIGAGSIAQRPVSQQVGQPSTEGVRTPASERTTGGGRVDEVGQRKGPGEITPDISLEDARVMFRSIIDSAFGKRDADIIYDVMFNDMSQTEVGKKYDISGERVNQIAGPKAQQEFGKRVMKALKRLGYTFEDLQTLNAVISDTVNKAEENGQSTVFAEDEEAIDTQREAGIQQAEETTTLGKEEILGDEEGGDKRGFRVFGGETQAGEVGIEDASSKNKTRLKYIKEKNNWKAYEDYELQNLIADQIAKPKDIEGIVNEVKRRQGITVAVKEETKPAKKTRQKLKKVEKAEEGLTLDEKAAQLWDKTADQYALPKYADLPAKSKDEWKNAVETGNTTLADMNTVFNKMEKPTKLASKAKRSFFDEIETEPGLDTVREHFKTAGIENALEFVSEWVIDPKLADGQGSIESIGGRYIVSVRTDPNYTAQFIAETARHEVGHAVDMAPQGGVYSAQPEMAVALKDGKVTATGKVAKELLNLYNTSDRWNSFLEYPFDVKTHTDLNTRVKIEAELFAQAFTVYTAPGGKQLMEQEAPVTAAYLKEVLNDIKSTKALQIQTARTATERRARFENRNAPERTQAGVSVIREGNQKLFRKTGEKVDRLRKSTQDRIDRMPEYYRNTAQRLYDFLTEGNIKDEVKARISFTRDLIEAAVDKGLTSASKYWNLIQQRQQILGRQMARLEGILEQYRTVNPQLQGTGTKTINGFLKDSTLDGKWGFQPDWLPPVEIDPNLQARFEILGKVDPKAQEVIKAVFKYYYDVNQEMKNSILETTNSEFDNLIKQARADGDKKEEAKLIREKAKSITEFQTLFRINSSKPYAALKRFGNHIVVAKSEEYVEAQKNKDTKLIEELQSQEKHYMVKFFESRSEALREYRNIQDKYFQVTKPFESANASEQEVYGGRDVNATFQRLRALATQDGNDATSRGMNQLLNSLQLKLLSEQSARQSENRRKDITGADDDMMRAFATQGKASAHFLASISNSSKIYEALREMRKERDDNPAKQDVTSLYYNELIKRHGMDLAYASTPVVDAALTATSTWMLLTSPAYYLQNATQPFLISMPYMAGKFGYTDSGEALTKAYNDVMSVIGKTGVSEADYDKLPPDVRKVVEQLVERGSINISLAAETGRFRSTVGATKDVVEQVGNAYAKATDILRGVAENVESVNRVATAVAAYRLAVKNKMSEKDAINYADEVIYRTHGDYSGANAPRFMRVPLGRIATQFRKFQLIQLSLIYKLTKESLVGESAETKAVARASLAYTLGHTFAIGGVMGLPGAAAAGYLMMALFSDEDDPDDAETKLRKMLGNGALATLLIKGAPAAAGVDVSGKLGMGQMLSILPYTDFKLTRESYAQGLVAAFGGPFFGGLGYKAIDALQYFGAGDYYKGLETLMPRGVSDVMKAGRIYNEGVTNKKGDVLIKPEDIGVMTAAFQLLGLPTTDLTESARLRSVAYKTEQFYKERTTALKAEYAKAAKEKDSSAQAEVRKKWEKLQESRIENGLKRQPMSTLLRSEKEQAKRERQTEGGVQYTPSTRNFVLRELLKDED